MKLVSLLLAVLKIVSALLDHLKQRRWRSEGYKQATQDIQDQINERAKRAGDARRAVDHNADSVSNDPNNRDTWP